MYQLAFLAFTTVLFGTVSFSLVLLYFLFVIRFYEYILAVAAVIAATLRAQILVAIVTAVITVNRYIMFSFMSRRQTDRRRVNN